MDLESQLPTNQFDKEMAEWAEKPLPERIARILLCCVLSVIVVFVAFWAVAALEERDDQHENYIPNCLHPYPEENRNDGQHSGVHYKQPKYKKLPKDQYYEEALLTPDANYPTACTRTPKRIGTITSWIMNLRKQISISMHQKILGLLQGTILTNASLSRMPLI
eukprot:265403_1